MSTSVLKIGVTNTNLVIELEQVLPSVWIFLGITFQLLVVV